MERKFLSRAAEFLTAQRHKKRWVKVVSAMAAVVVFCTTYALILPAITMEEATYCGLEGHQHGEACFETRLVCGYEEAEPSAHTHTAACYTEEQVLICTKEETPGHVHTESCLQEDGNYSCGLEEGEGGHTHDASCYESRRVLTCDLPEGSQVHTHTEECYQNVLVCEKPEHEHSLICYSNPEADVETESVWSKSVSRVDLTGVWAEDVIAIAQSQLGYTESTQNYTVDEDGQKKGYSRYGAWYGDPYGDWCAMFVSFCLHYAEIPETAIPYEANCDRWIAALQRKDDDLYRDAGSYTPETGDLIFFDWDDDGSADHVGLVEQVSEDSGGLKTIEGNSANRVRTVSYDLEDESILGYAVLPENPNPSQPLNAVENDDDEEEEEPFEEAVSSTYEVASVNLADTQNNQTISIHVQKQWVGDATYMRPDSITVTLLCNGEATDHTLTLTADNDWSGAFTGNFPKYDESGAEIEYTISEDAVTDYELASNTYADTASTVDLNSLELWVPVTELTAGEDYLAVSGLSGKQSLYRAESTVTDGVLSASVMVNEGSARDQEGNSYTNYILLNPEDETGQSQYLAWKAVTASGGMNLQSNVYTAWNGVTRYLLSQNGKWKVTDDGTLPAAIFAADNSGGFRAGDFGTSIYLFKKVSLDISSLPASSYTRDYTLVNRYEPATPQEPGDGSPPQATKTHVTAAKVWDDNADHSGDSVTVWLMRDGEPTEQSAVLNEENQWTCSFENLPIYNENGGKYVYDVQEEGGSSYRAEYTYETTSVAGEAIWLPTSSFEDGVTYLIVTSAATGDVIGMEASSKGFAWTASAGAGTIYVSSSDTYPRYITDEEAQQHTAMQWTAESMGLQKGEQVGSRYVFALKNVQYGLYAKNNGQGDLSNDCKDNATWWYYGYTRIDETGKEVNRYPKQNPESDWSYILGSMNDYFLLDNNHTGDGGSRAAQTFYLYRRYEVQEPQLNVTITNHKISETTLSVLKDWINDNPEDRPEEITIHLLANGEDTGKTLILSAENEWQGVFENLPTEDENGNQISYTVEEEPVEGYTSSYFYSSEDGTAKVVISNRLQMVLPETGGTGTAPYTMGGVLLILGAGGFLLYNYMKKRKEDSASS